MFFVFRQKTAYVMRIGDWSSDVGSSDLLLHAVLDAARVGVGHLLRVDAGAEGVFLRRLGEAVHRLADKLRQLARILRGAVERAGRVVIAREDILAFVGAVARLLQLALALRRLGTGVGEFRDRKRTSSELQSLMRISYAVFCLKKKNMIQQ